MRLLKLHSQSIEMETKQTARDIRVDYLIAVLLTHELGPEASSKFLIEDVILRPFSLIRSINQQLLGLLIDLVENLFKVDSQKSLVAVFQDK